MGIRKALYRLDKTRRKAVNPSFARKEKRQRVDEGAGTGSVSGKIEVAQKQKDIDLLRIIELSEQEAGRSDVPFVIKKLPENLNALQSVFKGKGEDWVRIYLKRAVDYHSPLATGSLKKTEIDLYNDFGMTLYKFWLKSEKTSIKSVCKSQIQEMLSQSLALEAKAEKHQFETLFQRFTKHLLGCLRANAEAVKGGDISKLADAIEMQQEISETTTNLFDGPSCKISDITIQLNAQILASFTDKVFAKFLKSSEASLVQKMIELWQSTISQLKIQQRAFLPQINFFLLKLLDLIKLKKLKTELKPIIKSYIDLAVTKIPQAQIYTAAVAKKLENWPDLHKRLLTAVSHTSLEHLCLRKMTPKPLFLYEPKIEAEFLMRVKKEMTDKTMKKKLKQAEKGVAKELSKDAVVIQQSRMQERRMRKAVAKKSVFKLGETLKDQM